MTIEKYPSKILLTKSTDVDTLEEGIEISEKLFRAMYETSWGKCVGMAAPQIGINKRVFIALGIVYINPEITFKSQMEKQYEDGCYSLEKNRKYKVNRPFMIKMKYMNLKGKIKESSFTTLNARVIHHEYEHLEGILCNHEKYD